MAEEETEAETKAETESEEARSEAADTDQDADNTAGAGAETRDSALLNVPVEISAILGTALMPVSQLLKVGRGAVLELDRKVGDPIDIYVNNRMVAQGEVTVIEDRLGVTLTDNLRAEDIIPSKNS